MEELIFLCKIASQNSIYLVYLIIFKGFLYPISYIFIYII